MGRSSDAKIINAEMVAKGYEPGYREGTKIFEFVTSEDDIWVRVVNPSSKPSGSWMMRKKDIEGLSPEALQIKYALPQKPTSFLEVHVPAGTKIRKGIIGANKFSNAEGAVQYELLDRLPKDCFKNPIDIITK